MKQLGATQCDLPHQIKEITGQSSPSSSWKPQVREDEEGGKVKRSLVNHQTHKTQTIIETVQTRLQELTKVATEFFGISSWQARQTQSGNVFSLLESHARNLLATDVHVFSDSVLFVWETTAHLQTKHGRQNSLKHGTRRHSCKFMISLADQCNSNGTYFQATQRSES